MVRPSRRGCRALSLVTGLAALGFVLPTFAAEVVPLGPEFRVSNPGNYDYDPDGYARAMKIQDKLVREGRLQFQVKVKGTTMAGIPSAPVTGTVILGHSPGATHCGRTVFTRVTGSRYYPPVTPSR